MKVTFKPNRRGIREAGRSESVYRELEGRADNVIRLAQAIYEPHRKSGDYGRGFRKERTRVRGMAAVTVTNVDPKALLLEKGSPPHVIEPKNKKALFWPGAEYPVRRVNHPGTPAYNILRRALRAAGR
jgi:hypothetical protein